MGSVGRCLCNWSCKLKSDLSGGAIPRCPPAAGKAICAAAGGAFCAFELSMYLCYEAEKEGGQYAGLQKMPLVQATDAY